MTQRQIEFTRRRPLQGRESVSSPVQSQFFETVAGPAATPYPTQSASSFVFYCKMLKAVSFTETVGVQALSKTVIPNKFRFVFTDTWVAEGTIILAKKINGQWAL